MAPTEDASALVLNHALDRAEYALGGRGGGDERYQAERDEYGNENATDAVHRGSSLSAGRLSSRSDPAGVVDRAIRSEPFDWDKTFMNCGMLGGATGPVKPS